MKKALWSLVKTNTQCMMDAVSDISIAYFKGKVDAYLVVLVSETTFTQKDFEIASRIVDKLYEKKMLFYT